MGRTNLLTAEAILGAVDVEERVVEVPQWGGAVRIRGLTKAAQQAIRRKATGPDGQVDPLLVERWTFLTCVVEPQFTEEQAEALWQKSAAAVDTVLQAILDLSGLTEEAARAAQRTFRAGPT